MNSILDQVWNTCHEYLLITVYYIDRILSPLEVLGPWFVILILALVVVIITKVLNKYYVTKRLVRLKKEYEHWKSVRDEAMNHPDKEKAKMLAKNIDQAELNKAYYDYFFEMMLKHFATNLIPILIVVTYVTTVYTPETLNYRFKSEWIFSFSFGENILNISSLFWFVISIVISYVLVGAFNNVKNRYAIK